MKTSEFNKEQKLLRKRLDKIAKEKIAISSKEKISPKAEHKPKDTSPPWDGDIPFNKGHKLP